jgi:uncharacterized protein YukE
MATVIDTLIVELGLDPKKFTKGQREAMAEARRSIKEGRDAAKEIEARAEAINNTLSKVKGQALSLFSLLAGGGVTALAVTTTRADASVSRLSRTLGESVPEIAAWQAAVKGAGGTAEGVAEHMTGLVSAFQRAESFHEPMQIQPIIAALDAESKRLGGVGVSLTDAAGKMKPIGEFYKELAFVFQKMVQTGPAMAAKAGEFARSLSIPEGLFDLLRRGTEETTKRLAEAAKIGVVTKQEAEQAERLAKAWENTSQSVVATGRTLLNIVSPTVIKILDALTKHQGDSNLRFEILQLGRMRDELESLPKGSPRRAVLETEIKQKEERVEEQLRARRGETPQPTGRTGEMSRQETEAYIRAAAARRGIDPEQAVRVARSEGLNAYQGDHDATGRATSFGPFQLHYAGTGKHTSPGLGEEFTKRTGLDARDPVTVRQQIDFALDEARKGGWGPWHGWRGDAWAGIDRSALREMPAMGANRPAQAAAPPSAVPPTAPAAAPWWLPPGPLGQRPGAQSAAMAAASNDNRTTTTTTTTEIRVENLNVQTQAPPGDGARIAADVRAALLDKSTIAVQANSGPQ